MNIWNELKKEVGYVDVTKGYFPERLILDWEDTFIRKRFVVYRLR